MLSDWSKIEPISPDDAQALADKHATAEVRKELDGVPRAVAKMVDLSVRAGIILHKWTPCAIMGVRYSGFTPVVWFIPLEGLRGKVREFIRYIRTIPHDGPLWTEPTDPKARLIRIAGCKPEGNFWRVK